MVAIPPQGKRNMSSNDQTVQQQQSEPIEPVTAVTPDGRDNHHPDDLPGGSEEHRGLTNGTSPEDPSVFVDMVEDQNNRSAVGGAFIPPQQSDCLTTLRADTTVPTPTEGGSVAGKKGTFLETQVGPAGAEDNDRNQKVGLPYSQSFLQASYLSNLPPHLMSLAHRIHMLDETDLVLITDVAVRQAKRDVYSLLPYTGGNWFLPTIRECEEGERHWGIWYDWDTGLTIATGGRRISVMLLNIFLRAVFIILVWFMLWNMLPHWLVLPGGYVWDPVVLVVVSSVLGGMLCRLLQIPPLVGVLWVGIMWNNIPYLHYLTGGIVREVFDISSKLGLTVILARAGFSLTWKGIKPHWKQSVLLSTIPFACEGVAHSLVANTVLHYNNDYKWAFLQGMLCSIVSPAVVVPGTLYLQELGYSRGVGPLSLMLSAVGVEIVIGVWCANFLIGLIFYDQQLAVAIVLGPVQLIGGTLVGIGLGFVYHYIIELLKREASRLPNGKYEQTHFERTMDFGFVIFLCTCLTMVFLGYGVNLAGGSCVVCVFFAACVSQLWTKDGNKELIAQKQYMGAWLTSTWDHLMLPLLFATMGAKIDILAVFNGDFFPKAVVCLVCSTVVRLLVIFLVQIKSGMPLKQKLVVCVGYIGKASAQASLGPIAANIVAKMIANLPPEEKGSLATMERYAKNVQQMAALYVMFMAAVASLGLVRGGMAVLPRDEAYVSSRNRKVSPRQGRTVRRDGPSKDNPPPASLQHVDRGEERVIDWIVPASSVPQPPSASSIERRPVSVTEGGTQMGKDRSPPHA